MTYSVTGRIVRITLDRSPRGNGITLELPHELDVPPIRISFVAALREVVERARPRGSNRRQARLNGWPSASTR